MSSVTSSSLESGLHAVVYTNRKNVEPKQKSQVLKGKSQAKAEESVDLPLEVKALQPPFPRSASNRGSRYVLWHAT